MPISSEISRPASNTDAIEYYDRNAQKYFDSTHDADLSLVYARFLQHLNKGDLILDIGSGSGRDTKAFIDRGFSVKAMDASKELALLSTNFTGLETQVKRIEDIDEHEKYDGVWACASLLHVRLLDLPKVFSCLTRALKRNGYLYTSFKLGSGERLSKDGRFYTDMNEQDMRRLIETTPCLNLKEIWISGGEDKFKGLGQWVNVIAKKD